MSEQERLAYALCLSSHHATARSSWPSMKGETIVQKMLRDMWKRGLKTVRDIQRQQTRYPR